MMKMGGRKSITTVTAIIVMLALAGAVGAVTQDGILGRGDADPQMIAPAGPIPESSGVCDPILSRLRMPGPLEDNPLKAVGISSDRLPKYVLDRGIANLTCIGDELAGRVEAVFLTIGSYDSGDAVLLLADGTPSSFVASYFDIALEKAPNRILEYEPGKSYIAINSNAMSTAAEQGKLSADFSSGSVWAAIRASRK